MLILKGGVLCAYLLNVRRRHRTFNCRSVLLLVGNYYCIEVVVYI